MTAGSRFKNFILTGSDIPSDPSNNQSGHPLALVFVIGDVRSGSVKQVGAAIGERAVVVAELNAILVNGAAASR